MEEVLKSKPKFLLQIIRKIRAKEKVLRRKRILKTRTEMNEIENRKQQKKIREIKRQVLWENQ